MGRASSSLTAFDPSGALVRHTPAYLEMWLMYTQIAPTSQEQQLAAENLYRDANTLIYGDNKPSEEAIDRVVGKINAEYVLPCLELILSDHFDSIDKKGKFSRKRPNEDEGDITYINEHNRVFNKKV